MFNIIHLDEGGVSNPYIVHERISHSANPKIPEGFKLIREQVRQEVYLLICEPIKDAEWIDIPTETHTKNHDESQKGIHVDKKV